LVRSLRKHIDCPLEHGALSNASSAFDKSDLLVQASSATLESNPGAAAFAQSLPLEALPDHATVVDMVYRPLQTAVLSRAAVLGLKTVDGLGMLLHQGAIAFEMWTGFEPPLDVMRAALED
jgi:shikimate dehydrogenase